MKKFLLVIFSFFLAVVSDVESFAKDEFITIGTGGVTGVYYPAGGAICRLVNRGRREHGIRCSVESTGGSIYNLNAVRNKELDIAVAQTDWIYNASKGTGPFAKRGKADPDNKLRFLFNLHSEPFTVVARNDAGIKNIDDIVGKRVNVGNPGSGMRATMDLIMQKKNWTKETFSKMAELKASEQAQALCDNKIDVMIYTAGHPNGAMQEVTSNCSAKLVNVKDSVIDALIADHPYYSYTIIPGGMYKGNKDDVVTFGVSAAFVSSSDVADNVIFEVVKSVFENFDDFKSLHPVFSSLKIEKMVSNDNLIPMHKGAEKYYREGNLLKK